MSRLELTPLLHRERIGRWSPSWQGGSNVTRTRSPGSRASSDCGMSSMSCLRAGTTTKRGHPDLSGRPSESVGSGVRHHPALWGGEVGQDDVPGPGPGRRRPRPAVRCIVYEGQQRGRSRPRLDQFKKIAVLLVYRAPCGCVAGMVRHDLGNLADRRLRRRHRVEIAHGLRSPRRVCSPCQTHHGSAAPSCG